MPSLTEDLLLAGSSRSQSPLSAGSQASRLEIRVEQRKPICHLTWAWPHKDLSRAKGSSYTQGMGRSCCHIIQGLSRLLAAGPSWASGQLRGKPESGKARLQSR